MVLSVESFESQQLVLYINQILVVLFNIELVNFEILSLLQEILHEFIIPVLCRLQGVDDVCVNLNCIFTVFGDLLNACHLVEHLVRILFQPVS